MAYNKTTWVNNTTPIDETNLNKLEQGVYDNSLVVDAVTNTLNPTDTETYKTAELTEGQITDVIGVSDIVIKGQTSQDGTPTPSAPVDVNVVSGSNVIKINNKNFFDKNNVIQGDWNNPNSSTSLVLYLGKISEGDKFTASNYNSRRFAFIISNMPIQSNQASALQSSGNQTATRSTFTATANGYVFFKITKTDGGNITPNEINSDDFQIEKGSTATTYEPHQGKELSLDLGKNLFNEDNYLTNTGINSDGTIATSNNNSLFYIPIKYGKKYTISFVDNGVSGNILYGFSNDKPVLNGTCTYNVLDITTLNNHTFTPVNANNKYLCIRLNVANTNQYQAMENIQVELGSEATKYVPYDPNPIELCKIGNYQDYFYKNGSKWYLHKEIGKVVLDGNASLSEQSQSGFYRYSYVNNKIKNDTSLANSLILFSDYFKAITFNNRNTEVDETIYSVCNGYSGQNSIQFNTKTFTSLSNFKTWLASNNVILYYLLNEVTNTEITDTTLISQLEAIYNAPLYEQTNITQTNNDLPMILDITACKDNINGIKAFIRK